MIAPMSLSQNDWSLHRKGPADARRHAEKVKEAIKESLPEIVAEEAIITSDGASAVKVPIRSLDLPRFRYDYGRNKHVGQGEGDSQAGRRRSAGQGQGRAAAGDEPGVDYSRPRSRSTTWPRWSSRTWGCRTWSRSRPRTLEREHARATTRCARRGQMANLDKRRTILENIKRNALAGRRAVRGRHATTTCASRSRCREVRRETNAVILAMRDVSGSMGEFEKYISRSFYFWMVRFLRTKYEQRPDRLHHPPHRGQGGRRGGLLQARRERRHARRPRPTSWPCEIVEERYDPASAGTSTPSTSPTATTGATPTTGAACELVERADRAAPAWSATARSARAASRSTTTLMWAFQPIDDPQVHPRRDPREAGRLPGAAQVLLARRGRRRRRREAASRDATTRTWRELRAADGARSTRSRQGYGLDPFPIHFEIVPADDHVRVRGVRAAGALLALDARAGVPPA